MKTSADTQPKTIPAYGLTDDTRFILQDMSNTMVLLSLAIDAAALTGADDLDGAQVASMLRTFQRITDQCIDGAPRGVLHVTLN